MNATFLCLAASMLGDHIIASDLHPVYNSRITPIMMGAGKARFLPEPGEGRDLFAIVLHRDLIASKEEKIKYEKASLRPDQERIEKLEKEIAEHKESLKLYDPLFKKYPDIEKRIAEMREKIKEESK